MGAAALNQINFVPDIPVIHRLAALARIESDAHCSRAAEERPSRRRESGSEAAAGTAEMRQTFGDAG
jgi:hypothetical protein